jgi:hypothetical protein
MLSLTAITAGIQPAFTALLSGIVEVQTHR